MQSIDKSVSQLTSGARYKAGSWFANRCRDLLFKILDTMDKACLTIEEEGKVTRLGNSSASLQATMIIYDGGIFADMVKGGSIAAGEGYILGQWDTPNLTQLIQVFAKSQEALDRIEGKISWLSAIKNKLSHRTNANTQSGSKRNIVAHYDLGNGLYERFLDPTMMYSCAIYHPEQASDLDAAQQLKLKTICEQLALSPDDHLVEIGTGWGGLAIYAATHYGCKVTTTTISDEQYQLAESRIKQAGLTSKITLLNKDYRELEGQYDKLVSIEMIEAVGHEFFATFFATCNRLLKDNGRMLIQAITISDQRYDHYRRNVDFIQKYIFPGGCLPSVSEMTNHIIRESDMVVDSVRDIGLHYARTLADWRVRFHQRWDELQQLGFKDDFKRLWHYYLCYCEGAFLERVISTVHLTARKPGYLAEHEKLILDYPVQDGK